MKRVFLILVCTMLIGSLVNAQYKVNKTKYDFRTYSYQVGDPYNVGVSGVASLLIPGLGQMLSGEAGRGLAFLGGSVGCGIIMYAGAISAANDINEGGTGGGGSAVMVVGALAMLTVDIAAIVDAVRVAKVNNLAFRDQTKSSLNLKISPYVSFNDFNIKGVSLKVTF